MHIHARAIHYFDMIRRAGSIRAAARQLHVTASAVNRQLLLLEAELGAQLFERLRSGLQLTAAGEVFARHVTHVLQDAQRLEAELDALRGLRRGRVSMVLVAAGVISSLMPRLLMQMRERYPQISLQVDVVAAQQGADAVAQGEADLALGFLPRHPELRQCAVARFDFGAVMAPDHPLARRERLTFAECAAYPLILPTRQVSGTWRAVAPLLEALDQPAEVVLEAGSIDLMKEMAAQGAGISIQNRLGIERDIAAGRLVHIPLEAPGGLYADLGVYVRAGRALPPPVDALVRLTSDELVHLAQTAPSRAGGPAAGDPAGDTGVPQPGERG